MFALTQNIQIGRVFTFYTKHERKRNIFSLAKCNEIKFRNHDDRKAIFQKVQDFFRQSGISEEINETQSNHFDSHLNKKWITVY